MNHYYRYEKYNKQSLEALSKKYNVPVCMILNANGVISDYYFKDLKKIKIPYPCYCEREKTCVLDHQIINESHNTSNQIYNLRFIEYTVIQNESLFDITKKHGVTESLLIRLNTLKSPNEIKDGKKIKIPVFDFDTMIYNVLPRETLKDIADRFRLDYKDIAKINAIEVFENIYPSMKLILPKRKETK